MPDPGTDLTPTPQMPGAPAEQQAPAAPEPPPDPTMDQARALWGGLQNLDTRAETLGRTLVPGQDLPPGMDWQTARAALFAMQQPEPEEEADPWEQFQPAEPQFLGYDQQGQPVWDNAVQQQQAPGFDPRTLEPVFDHQRAALKQEIMAEIQQQQKQQAWTSNLSQGVDAASREHNLSDFARQTVEAMARTAAERQPNRAPAEVAQEVAAQYVADANARFVAQGGVPPAPAAPLPGGPIPGERRPQTVAEALEFSNRPGVMNRTQ